MSFILAIASFFVSAFALKLALGALGQPKHENKYGTALTVAGILSVTSFVLGFLPFYIGWLLYPILWLGIVKSVYHIGFGKSMAVAVLQLVIRVGLSWLLYLLF